MSSIPKADYRGMLSTTDFFAIRDDPRHTWICRNSQLYLLDGYENLNRRSGGTESSGSPQRNKELQRSRRERAGLLASQLTAR